MTAGPSINFPSARGTFRQLSSTFHSSAGHSIIILCGHGTFCQLSKQLYVWPRDFLSTFLAPMGPSLKFSSTFRVAGRPSVNFPCIHGTFCKHLSTFLESAGPSSNFRQISVGPRDLPSTFHASMGLPSTFHAYAGPSVDFPQLLCIRGTFSEFSMHLRDLLSTFRACVGPSVDFSQL